MENTLFDTFVRYAVVVSEWIAPNGKYCTVFELRFKKPIRAGGKDYTSAVLFTGGYSHYEFFTGDGGDAWEFTADESRWGEDERKAKLAVLDEVAGKRCESYNRMKAECSILHSRICSEIKSWMEERGLERIGLANLEVPGGWRTASETYSLAEIRIKDHGLLLIDCEGVERETDEFSLDAIMAVFYEITK